MASLWLIVGRLVARGVDLIGLVILARLLGPAAFGLVAIAMGLVMIAEAVLELPVSQVLIVEPDISESMFATAFTLSILRGLTLAAVLWLIAWPFSAIYGNPLLWPIVAALALAPAIRGVQSPKLAIHARNLDFRRPVAMDVLSKLAALAVSVSIAYWTGSYWALVCGTIASPAVATLLSFVLAPYRPRLSLADWRLFRNFLGWLSAGQIFTAISWQMDRLVLGKVATSASVGRFTMADNLAALPGQIFLVPIIGPLSAALVTVRDDRTRLAEAYTKLIGAITLIGMPTLVGVAMLAGPVVALCLGDRWQEAVPILQWLALAWIPGLLWAPFNALALTVRKPAMIFRRQLFDFLVKVPLVIGLGVTFFIPGVAVARGIAGTVLALWCFHDARALIGIGLLPQLRAMARPAAGCGTMAAALYLATPAGLIHRAFPILLVEAAGLAALGVLVYVCTVALAWWAAGSPPGGERMVVSLVEKIARRGSAGRVRPGDPARQAGA